MIRLMFCVLFVIGIASTSLAQEKKPPAKQVKSIEKMTLRANTRDKIMLSRGTMNQIRTQVRKPAIVRKNQQMQQQRMMIHRQSRSLQMKNQQRIQRQMLEQRRIQQQQRRTSGRH